MTKHERKMKWLFQEAQKRQTSATGGRTGELK